MRLAALTGPAGPRPALVVGEARIGEALLALPSGPGWPTDMVTALRTLALGGVPADVLTDRLADLAADGAALRSAVPLTTAVLDAPVRPAGMVYTIGANYHAPGEARSAITTEPLVLGKLATAVVGPDSPISWDPRVLTAVGCEVELGVVIGRPGRDIAEADAMDHVLGYACVNDVASREPRFDGERWLVAKSHPTFCPVGPWLVTADEVPDPHDLTMRCWRGGRLVQDGTTADMRHRIPDIVAWLSRFVPLATGDLIATGTPVAVEPGATDDLHDGEEVVIEIEQVGRLRNRVVLPVEGGATIPAPTNVR